IETADHLQDSHGAAKSKGWRIAATEDSPQAAAKICPKYDARPMILCLADGTRQPADRVVSDDGKLHALVMVATALEEFGGRAYPSLPTRWQAESYGDQISERQRAFQRSSPRPARVALTPKRHPPTLTKTPCRPVR